MPKNLRNFAKANNALESNMRKWVYILMLVACSIGVMGQDEPTDYVWRHEWWNDDFSRLPSLHQVRNGQGELERMEEVSFYLDGSRELGRYTLYTYGEQPEPVRATSWQAAYYGLNHGFFRQEERYYTYDEEGRKTSFRDSTCRFSTPWRLEHFRTYSYDEEGQLTMVRCYTHSDTIHTGDSLYTYLPDGRLSTATFRPSITNNEASHWWTDSLFYRSDGLCERRETWAESRDLKLHLYTTHYRFDEHGHTTSTLTVVYPSDGSTRETESAITNYSYDEQGRIIAYREVDKDGFVNRRCEFVYEELPDRLTNLPESSLGRIILKDGHLLIERGGRVYDLVGRPN